MSNEPVGASVRVIKGGNRVMEITVHCVCRDQNGQLQWAQDAKGHMIVPANYAPDNFVVEGPVTTRIVPKGEL